MVVGGFRLDALFSKVREFVVGQSATGGVGGGVFEEAEGDLVDAVICQV